MDAQAEPTSARGEVLKGRRALVVQKDDRLRRGVVRQLEALGAEVTEVRDAAEALHAAGRVQPDVVVVDLMLPSARALQLGSALRHLAPHRDLHLVAMCATNYVHNIATVRAHGFHGYVTCSHL